MRGITYYRVSSDSQRNNTSLDNQRSKVEDYAFRNSIEIVANFEDVASGGNTNREGLQNALSYIKDHKGEIEVFMVYKYDRAHRNLKETLIFVDNLEKMEISYVSVSQKIDTTTPQGRLFFQLVCSFAEFEKEVIREQCREGRKAKIGKGQVPGGRAPLGYDKNWCVDEEEVVIVKDLFKKYLKLKSFAKLSKYAAEKGYRDKCKLTLSRTSLRSILSNRAYLGEFVYNGEQENHKVFWKNHHECAISPQLFGKIAALIKRNRRNKNCLVK